MSFKCEYCNKSFAREKTLVSHTCEQKRRHIQQNDPDVRIAFRAYQLFYRIGTNSKKEKTYTDFAKSQYYSAFVRFGVYCIDLRIDDIEGYTTWLLNNSIKLDKWSSDQNFNKWIRERLKRESVDRAVERTVIFMMDWANSVDLNWSDYFTHVNPNQAVFHICAGRISPWVIYASNDAQQLLDRFNQEQLQMVIDYIDPKFWQVRIARNKQDIEWVEKILNGEN
jgi:hypothetical protein